MLKRSYFNILKITVAIFIIFFLTVLFIIASDLRSFEIKPLMQLAGVSGLTTALAWISGAIIFTCVLLRSSCTQHYKLTKKTRFLLATWLILNLVIIDWLFLETPITFIFKKNLIYNTKTIDQFKFRDDFYNFSLTTYNHNNAARPQLHKMYERIIFNNPDAYSKQPLGSTIDKYAKKYSIDPISLFFFAYINSFWGEATSGPMPFTHAMTSETFRDLVQAHLPSWFIESEARKWLITSNFFERVTGKYLGFKLRYAFHKATLDISTQPYDLNLFSDVLLVLKEYPNEFPELTEKNPTPLIAAFQRSYHEIVNSALIPPYETPYYLPAYPDSYYKNYRDELKSFARSSFYLTITDFDFATRLMSLNIKYQINYYEKSLGSERWNALPKTEQISLIGMTRDLYTKNIGHPSYNLYSLPELNCTPVEFVANSFLEESPTPDSIQNKTWRPKNYQMLWGGAATKLRILSEVWMTVTDHTLPGIEPEDSLSATSRVIN